MRVFSVNPSDVACGVGIITRRWFHVLADEPLPDPRGPGGGMTGAHA